MIAIFKRELGAFFHSIVGWLFLAVNLFFVGLYFTALNLFYGAPGYAGTISGILFLLIVTIPILTMRILAEEKKQKTDQLILTAPVSVIQIVVGKYLAVAAIFTMVTLVMAAYPLLLGRFGAVSYSESYTALMGYYLYGLAGLSIGLFASALTESQVIAAVVAFGILFVTYMMSGIISLISQTGSLVTRLLGVFDWTSRFSPFLSAQLDWTGVLYFLSVLMLMLFLTCQVIQKRRWSMSVKHIRNGAYNVMLVALVCAITVVLNLMAEQLPASYRTLDMTAQKLYSLTDQSKKLLAGLKEDVAIYVLQDPQSSDTTLSNTLDQYDGLSGRLTVTYINPAVNPNFHTKYTTDESITLNSVIVESDKRYKVIPYSSLYETEYDYYSYQSTVTGYDGEGQLTSAIAYVTSDDMPKVYTLTGHNELELSTTFLDGIQKQNIEVESLNLLTCENIPEDAQSVILNAPTSDLSEDDAKKLVDYLQRGGNLLVTTAFTEEAMPNFSSVLDQFGVSLAEGMVMETDRNYYYQSPYYLLPQVEPDAITDHLDTQTYVFMPYAQGLLSTEEKNIQITSLLRTSDSAYSKISFSDAQALTKEEGDLDGPFSLALKAEKRIDEVMTATLLLFGSEALFTDTANEAVSGNNATLFISALTALTKHESSVAIPVKRYALSQILVADLMAATIGACTTLVLPLGLFLAGVMVWYKRVHHR